MATNVTFKKPLTIDEQIEHLKRNKRVVFNAISEEEAKVILYECNYINVITPFKHFFFKKYKGKTVKDKDNKHIYDRDVEFKEYFDKYDNERFLYSYIYKTIYDFETLFNSMLSYETIHYYNLESYDKFDNFINVLSNQINSLRTSDEQKKTLNEVVSKFNSKLKDCNSIYIFFDRLSLAETLTVFRLVDLKLQMIIFDKIKKCSFNFNASNITQFIEITFKIVSIRNCVCHGNSLEILKRFYNYRTKVIRSDSEYKSFERIINKLALFYK